MPSCNGKDTGFGNGAGTIIRHASELTSNPCLSGTSDTSQQHLENGFMERERNSGAAESSPAAFPTRQRWETIDWAQHERIVRRLQRRIAKATKNEKRGVVKALQHILTSSWSAKLLAVRRVTTNKGKNTPGVDDTTWKSTQAKMKAAQELKARGYKARPLRRVYIPKSNGKRRALGIPTMHDRAMQALWALALEPIAETTADHQSYGFRPHRCVADAIRQCQRALARRCNARWVLEGDIEACFDQIDHKWLRQHIPMNQKILGQWLDAGYVDKNALHHSREGTPQGGIASPILANMVLDGMEKAIKRAVPAKSKVNFIRYADDFLCTGIDRQILQDKVLPAIRAFLGERGLKLSKEKTLITNIRKGVDFLGFHLRKFGHKLVTRPQDGKVKAFRNRLKSTARKLRWCTAREVIPELNQKLRGWTNFYKIGTRRVHSTIDHYMFETIWRELKRRHPTKGAKWIRRKYFRSQGRYSWVFAALEIKGPKKRFHYLYQCGSRGDHNYRKIRAESNPFDPNCDAYLRKRGAINMKERNRLKRKFVTISKWQRHIPGQRELFETGSS